MIYITHKKIFLKILDAYFLDSCYIDRHNFPKVDIVKIIQCNHIQKSKFKEDFSTLVVDLSLSEERLFTNVNKKLRYDIRRAINDNTYSISFLKSDDIKSYKQAIQALDLFLKNRKLPRLNLQKLEAMWKNDLLKISIASLNGRESGDILGVHVYLVDEKELRSRLLYSYSNFLEHPYVNKVHHWKDIIFLKRCGMIKYDFGGISTNGSTDRIDHFKMKFGGVLEQSYSLMAGLTFKGRLVLFIYKLLSKAQ